MFWLIGGRAPASPLLPCPGCEVLYAMGKLARCQSFTEPQLQARVSRGLGFRDLGSQSRLATSRVCFIYVVTDVLVKAT